MNKTVPNDGKQNRQSQEYVPSGPIWSKVYSIRDNHAKKAESIASHYGEVIEFDDGVRGTTKLYPDWTFRMSQRKRGLRTTVLAKKRRHDGVVRITVLSDDAGHGELNRVLYGELGADYYCWPYPSKSKGQVEEPPTNRPPVVKRLTGKERKIAKKRAAIETGATN